MQAPTVGGREFPLSSSQGFWTIDVLQVSMNNGGKGKAGLPGGKDACVWPQGLDDPEVSLLGLVVSSDLSMLHTRKVSCL